MSGEEALTAAGGWCAPSDPGSRDLGVDLIYPGNVSWSGWRVQQVASWWEISSGRTVVVTRRWATLEQVVAIVRVLGALPMPGSSVADP